MNERDVTLLEEIAELKRRKQLLQQKAEEERAEEARRLAALARGEVPVVPKPTPPPRFQKKSFRIMDEDTIDLENELIPMPAKAPSEEAGEDTISETIKDSEIEEEIIEVTSDKASEKISDIEIPSAPTYVLRIDQSSSTRERTEESYSTDEGERKLRFDQYESNPDVISEKPATMGIRFEYARTPKPCERYLDVEEFSKLFVDDLTEEALTRAGGFRHLSAIKIVEGITYTDSDESLSESYNTYVCLFEWPTIQDFTVEIGIQKLDEYISYWKFTEDWKHCINFLGGESDSACDYYRYEAIFGIPCKQYPISQATASVYFTFEISRIRPKSCLVDMYYFFEGQRMRHTPGKCSFQEDRLFNVVDAKLNFYKTLTY